MFILYQQVIKTLVYSVENNFCMSITPVAPIAAMGSIFFMALKEQKVFVHNNILNK
jgi:hypothetical protein